MTVVFCPYLAAMWCSMRSLYDEHVAAGDDVSVMPLPYCTQDYGGNLSPYMVDVFSVPTIPADITALERSHPDRIYFHNPYDDHNRITMVNPSFFSNRLAACTNDLVFVPYYTNAYTDGDDIETVIRSAAVRRSNHIVVWSEAQKERYSSILCEYSREWADRIVVKRRSIRQFEDVPKQWQDVARGRRLVMLGTSLSTLMTGRQVALNRLFDAIRDNQNDNICLVFRPHPLYMATIRAMMPELGRSYRAIVNDFVENNRGILDTTPDVERSVYYCREYIGNASSIVALFREQGKPVRIF